MALKKIISLILSSIMALLCFAACADGNDESAAQEDDVSFEASALVSNTDETSSPWADGIVGYLGDGEWGREMPEFTWDRDTFNVLVYSNNIQGTYFSEEIEPNLYDTTDAMISEAVGMRNEIIREKYGVEIKAVLCDDVYITLTRQIATGGDDCVDAAMPFLYDCTVLASNGQLFDLREFEADGYIDLSMPWWEKNAIDAFTIADKVYYCVGDMSIMQKIVSSAVMYNKDMLAQKYPDVDLYQEVRDKKWTLDRMISISRDYTYESDNVDGMTWLDTWGFGGTYGNAVGFYSSSGNKLVDKDSSGKPVVTIGSTESQIMILQNILEKLTEKNTWILHAEEMGGDIWVKCIQAFGEGRTLFRGTAFSGIKKVRAFDVNFGLLPLPLMSDNQDDYYTSCSAKYAYGTVIPISAPDPEFSAFMIDLMSAMSKGETAYGLTRAYIEVVIKGKDLKADDEACEILDNYIFKNIVYDLGIVHDLGIDNMLYNMVKTGSTDVVSMLDANRDAFQAKLDDIIELYGDR